MSLHAHVQCHVGQKYILYCETYNNYHINNDFHTATTENKINNDMQL